MESEFIYHVTTKKAWEDAQAKQSYVPADFEKDGFLHRKLVKSFSDLKLPFRTYSNILLKIIF